MADFSFLSDTDDSAVEDLISQTQELCVLEQVAAINCSGFTDSSLPSDLESRFRKLKSFPAAKSKPKKLSSPSPPPSSSDFKSQFDFKKERKKSAERDSDSEDESVNEIFSPAKQNPAGKTPLKPRKRPESAPSPPDPSDSKKERKKSAESERDSDDESENGIFSPAKQNPIGKTPLKPRKRPESAPSPPVPSDSKKERKKSAESERDSDDDSENEIFSPAKQNPTGKTPLKPRKRPESDANFSHLKETPNGKKGSKSKSKPKPRSISSSSSEFSDLSMDSPSPPRSAGCLWWSPKKSSGNKKKKNKKKPRNRKLGGGDLDCGSDEDFLSDLGIFSAKERQKIMSKAMKAEEKINREAERIVKWAKQASARMRASNIIVDHELSDDDHTTK